MEDIRKISYFFFFFKQKTAYEIIPSLVGSEMCIRDSIQTTVQESVVNYARKAQEAGLDGVVCSAHEVALIKDATSSDFVCVTPGIRPAGAEIGDQKRVMTPQEAHKIGSDYIVVGRPIIQAENPWDAYHEIKRQWNS